MAFAGCTSLTSIDIPDGVTTIGASAFNGCENLTSITIPDSVTTIGGAAFYDCKSLTSITIPDGVTKIEVLTFNGCESLTSLTIPESVKRIEGVSSVARTGLTSIKILNPDCYIYDDAAVISETTTIYCYENSTAHKYAEKYGRSFEFLEKQSKVMGDINDDGEFNVADVVLLNKYLLGMPNAKLSDWHNADLCADDKLDVFDLCMMKKKLVEDLI